MLQFISFLPSTSVCEIQVLASLLSINLCLCPVEVKCDGVKRISRPWCVTTLTPDELFLLLFLIFFGPLTSGQLLDDFIL